MRRFNMTMQRSQNYEMCSIFIALIKNNTQITLILRQFIMIQLPHDITYALPWGN